MGRILEEIGRRKEEKSTYRRRKAGKRIPGSLQSIAKRKRYELLIALIGADVSDAATDATATNANDANASTADVDDANASTTDVDDANASATDVDDANVARYGPGPASARSNDAASAHSSPSLLIADDDAVIAVVY